MNNKWILSLIFALFSSIYFSYSVAETSNESRIQYDNNLRMLILSPHKEPLVNVAPTPVDVKVTVSNANWVETISICNTTSAAIPLKNIEFDFNYAVPMPTNIWGIPWEAWRVSSQNGNAVVLVGGTPFTPPLPSDPFCMNPLTIQFNASPTTPAPTGPFIFKAEGSTPPPPLTGNLNVALAAAPAGGLTNPTLTVAGPNTNQQKVVTWGTTWSLPSIPVGNYTITGTPIAANGQTYTADPVNTAVTSQNTTNVTITYKGGTTVNNVTVTLINAPAAQVPLTLTGSKATFNQSVSNGTVLSLPNDSYSVTSNVAGYTATATPNPLVVPTNKTLSISYTANGGGGAGSRTLTMVNQCPFPVWFGFVSGATRSRANSETCNTDADCWPNNTCVDRGAGGKHCFWTNPVPANNNFQLAANGGTNSVVIPYVNAPTENAVWSGLTLPRTNCTAAGCETGDCGAGTGGCPTGRGAQAPATLAEFTFNTTQNDFYDVTAVNGLNLPVSMAPVNATTNPNDPYYCGTPGATTSTSQIGACSWSLTPTRMEFNWVRAGGNACAQTADCAGGMVCGLSFNPGKTPLFQKTCGVRIGYWNANQICGVDPNYGAPFNCQQQLPAPDQGRTMRDLLGCINGIDTCYKNGAVEGCCGCVNWDKVGVPGVPPAPFTTQCVNKFDFWIANVMPDLRWIKQACPPVYTYPFDDVSSTFQCRVNQTRDGQAINSTSYIITFCPGGKTGGVQA